MRTKADAVKNRIREQQPPQNIVVTALVGNTPKTQVVNNAN
ncbi:MAG: hypothetical protein WBL63_08755 [Candidatus Acidiferrum sp.]